MYLAEHSPRARHAQYPTRSARRPYREATLLGLSSAHEATAELCSVSVNQSSWNAGHGTYLNPDIDIPRTAWEFLSQFRLPGP